TSSGKMIRVDTEAIREAGRNTSGVKIVNVGKDKVAYANVCPKEPKEDDLNESNPE
ncbi:DNA gyrase C-terminal beta-propeller domain-containing protein, partial [Helicobacter typhlonius]